LSEAELEAIQDRLMAEAVLGDSGERAGEVINGAVGDGSVVIGPDA